MGRWAGHCIVRRDRSGQRQRAGTLSTAIANCSCGMVQQQLVGHHPIAGWRKCKKKPSRRISASLGYRNLAAPIHHVQVRACKVAKAGFSVKLDFHGFGGLIASKQQRLKGRLDHTLAAAGAAANARDRSTAELRPDRTSSLENTFAFGGEGETFLWLNPVTFAYMDDERLSVLILIDLED